MARKGIRVWTCDACGKRETWRKGWQYFPNIDSVANVAGDGLIYPWACCSNACADLSCERGFSPSAGERG